MIKYFTNNFVVINLYKKASVKSEVVTQMIYGDSFSVSRRSKKWLKIKIKENISIDLIGWNESNYYYKNIESGVIEKAKQHIHPRLPALSIEFYYKF